MDLVVLEESITALLGATQSVSNTDTAALNRVKHRVPRNVGIGRLPVLPAEVQVVCRSRRFSGPAASVSHDETLFACLPISARNLL